MLHGRSNKCLFGCPNTRAQHKTTRYQLTQMSQPQWIHPPTDPLHSTRSQRTFIRAAATALNQKVRSKQQLLEKFLEKEKTEWETVMAAGFLVCTMDR